MAFAARVLASGPGWKVTDAVCTSGPGDRPYEEQHDAVCVAAVTEGTFQYRTDAGSAVLAPGSVLLGNAGSCFECGHEHGTGDRCLAFHLEPALLETVLSAAPGTRRQRFGLSHLPPLPDLMPLLVAAEVARDEADAGALEEITLRLAGAVAATLADAKLPAPSPSSRDERRISEALRHIEAAAEQRLALADLARAAGMSPCHFLRTFRQAVGMTPHQYVLRTRLGRAAFRLRTSNEAISAIAFDAGFGDLSTFNRRFRRLMGCSPGSYRARGGPDAGMR